MVSKRLAALDFDQNLTKDVGNWEDALDGVAIIREVVTSLSTKMQELQEINQQSTQEV